MANLPTDHAAGLASLMARGNDPSALGSLIEKRQNSSMSDIIDSYIVNLKQAGFVPNANATISKRDTLSLDPLIEKRSIPSVPLVIDLLEQHGFVPTNNTSATPSKRDASDAGSALEKRTLPDIDLVISRLAAYGFIPSNNDSSSTITKRDAAGDINTVISQLEAYGFNPNDFMQGDSLEQPSANSSSSYLTATTGVTCPQDDQKTFSTGNETYEVLCGAGYNGFDLTNVHSDSLPDCLAACSAYVPQGNLLSYGPCAGATWLASFADANCFFKYDTSTSGADSRAVSGRKTS